MDFTFFIFIPYVLDVNKQIFGNAFLNKFDIITNYLTYFYYSAAPELTKRANAYYVIVACLLIRTTATKRIMYNNGVG